MRNLARLTHAADRIANGPRTHDGRYGPRCAQPGCRRACANLGEGQPPIIHCYRHATPAEWQAIDRVINDFHGLPAEEEE